MHPANVRVKFDHEHEDKTTCKLAIEHCPKGCSAARKDLHTKMEMYSHNIRLMGSTCFTVPGIYYLLRCPSWDFQWTMSFCSRVIA